MFSHAMETNLPKNMLPPKPLMLPSESKALLSVLALRLFIVEYCGFLFGYIQLITRRNIPNVLAPLEIPKQRVENDLVGSCGIQKSIFFGWLSRQTSSVSCSAARFAVSWKKYTPGTVAASRARRPIVGMEKYLQNRQIWAEMMTNS